MTIQEIQLEKKRVDDLITKAIIEFTNKTGMEVNNVNAVLSQTKCYKTMRYHIIASLPEREYLPSFS